MKLKSLMLGAAAAAAATTAQAADLPVAPEPVDYVRVCDAYGARFYYIPGTETCLRVGGRVRTQVVVNNVLEDGASVTVTPTATPGCLAATCTWTLARLPNSVPCAPTCPSTLRLPTAKQHHAGKRLHPVGRSDSWSSDLELRHLHRSGLCRCRGS